MNMMMMMMMMMMMSYYISVLWYMPGWAKVGLLV
jgi:hypothetical protein